MALPIINEEISFIKIKLPSNKKIGVRGWKVKDEKELLFSLDSEDNVDENKVNHIIKFMRNCVDNQAMYDQLSEQDLKKIAIEIRKISKGDRIEYNLTCPHCQFKTFDEIHLSKSEVIKDFDISPIIVNEDLTIVIKDLSFNNADKLFEKYKNSPNKYTYYFMVNSIEAITYKNEVYTGFSESEMDEWLGPLNSTDLEKIYKALEDNTSNVTLERKINCIKCKEEINVGFGNLFDFLIL